MKACNDIDFLSNYWKEVKAIGNRVKADLPLLATSNIKDIRAKDSTSLMYIVNFSDISGQSWGVSDVLKRAAGKSVTLSILADKINHMILMNRANDVKPMLEKICSGRIKSLSKTPAKHYKDAHSEFLGRGHFRWNEQAYTLTPLEIKRIKKYFSL